MSRTRTLLSSFDGAARRGFSLGRGSWLAGQGADPAASPAFSSLFLWDDDRNRHLYDRYRHFLGHPLPDLGLYRLADVSVTDPWGLIFDDAHVFNLVPGFGWSAEHFDHLAAKGSLAARTPEVVDLAYQVTDCVTLDKPAAMLTFPGGLTYGHWIVDVLGRLEILAALHDGDIDHYLTPAPVTPWMTRILALAGVEAGRLVPLTKTTRVACRTLLVPSVPSQSPGGVLPYALFRRMFRRVHLVMAQWVVDEEAPDETGRPLMVRHTPMTSQPHRALGNMRAVEQAFIETCRGVVVDPLTLTLPDLMRAIARAPLVVGQDCSALHNAALIGRDIVVMETEPRANLLHCALQHATGRKVGYVASRREGEAWHLDPNVLCRRVRGAMAAVRPTA